MKTAILGGAFAGSVGAVVMVVVLVAWPTAPPAIQSIDRSLDRSGVVVVSGPSTNAGLFEDPVGAFRLAGVSLVYGLIAGAALGVAAGRRGRRWWVAGIGLGVAVAVLAAAGHATARELIAQVGFWAAAALALACGGGRSVSRNVQSGALGRR